MRFPKFLFGVILVFSLGSGANADELSDSVADAFGFPRSKLRNKDLIAALSPKERGAPKVVSQGVKAAYLIDSPDNTFAFVSLRVTERGLSLTAEVEERLKAAVLGMEQLPPERRRIFQIDVPKLGRIYTFPAGMGPGGATQRALIRLEAQGIDVTLDQTVNFEDPLDVTAETQAYYDALDKDSSFPAKSLAKALETISRDIVAGKYSFAKAVASPVVTPAAEPPPILPPVPPPPANTAKAEPEVAPTVTAQKDKSSIVLWLLLLVVLAVAIALNCRKKSK